MKLKKLTLKNIASIEDAVIAFDETPLNCDPVFLICGDTGSGKTTILDGICLALYNETPRMNKTAMRKYTESAADGHQELEISINDRRQLMRRNTGEAWSILEFVGTDEHVYRAQWYVSKARKKNDGNLQQVKWSLEDCTLQFTWTKSTEIKQQILKAVGLTFEQYCRTALLAQGDFTQFLHSGETEKSEILEKLTGTEIYSKIGSQIFTSMREKKNGFETMKQRMQDIRVLSEEEKQNTYSIILEQKSLLQTLEKQLQQENNKQDWLEKLDAWNEQLAIAEKQWKQRKDTLQSEVFKQKEYKPNLWNKTEEVRTALKQKQEILEIAAQCTAQEASLTEDFIQGNNHLEWNLIEQKKKAFQITELDKELKLMEALIPMYENCPDIKNKLQQVDAIETRILKRKATLKQIEEKLPTEEALLKKTSEEILQMKERLTQLQLNIDALRKEVEDEKYTKKQTDQKRLSEEQQHLNNAKNVIDRLREKLNQKNELTEENCKLKNILQELETQLQKLEIVAKEKNYAFQQADELLRKQKFALSEWAKEMRLQLTIGDTCPVCGKQIDSNLSEDNFQSALKPLQENLEKAKKEYEQSNHALIEAQTKYKATEERRTEQDIQLKKACEAFLTTKQETIECCKLCGIVKLEKTTESDVIARIEENKKALDLLDKQLEARQQQINQLNQRQKEKDKLQMDADTLNNRATEKELYINSLKQSISEGKAENANEQQEMEAIEKETLPLLLWENSHDLWHTNRQALIQRLEKETDRYQYLLTYKKELTEECKQKQIVLEQCLEQKQQVEKMFSALKDVPVNSQESQHNLKNDWNELFQKATALNVRISQNKAELESRNKMILDFCNQHPELHIQEIEKLALESPQTIEALRIEVQQQKDLLLKYEAQMQQIKAQLNEHLQHKPKLNDEDSKETCLNRINDTKEAIAQKNQEIGRYQAILDNNELNLKKYNNLLQDAERIQKEYLQWNELYTLFGDEKGNKFRNIAQSYVLKELLERANYYLEQLTERYELSCQPGSLTILLKDWFQGGVIRPTSTLSGGESFLISLSLALGLSSLNRQSFSVDTLFIDEGFGTLSSDYLNVVMDTLERLHQIGGKKVGIISHVDELRERIKTQIRVKRIDQGRSKIEVINNL